MYTTTCSECGKIFDCNGNVNGNLANAVGRDSGQSCYACALQSLTAGRAPEEGDFNSARLISGEISDEELGWLMEDLRAVEQGRSIVEPYEDENEYIDLCSQCGCEISNCYCDDENEDMD